MQAENEAIKARVKRLEELLINEKNLGLSQGRSSPTPSATGSQLSEMEDSKALKVDIDWLLKVGSQKHNELGTLTKAVTVRIEPIDEIVRQSFPVQLDNLTVRIPPEHQAFAFFDEYLIELDPAQHISEFRRPHLISL